MWLDEIKFDERGLVPVIAQDKATGRILMLAWANREALDEAARTGRAVYFSRSRGKLWRKGESSGNVQRLHAIELDCDGDALIYQVEQVGGIACHTGRASCFWRVLTPEHTWQVSLPVLRDPKEMYGE